MIVRVMTTSLLIWLSSACTAAPNHSARPSETARSFTATLVRVVDGDSLWVRDRTGKKHELRLAGIDAPERRQAGGPAATEALRSLLADDGLRITAGKTDRYKRLIARVQVKGQDVSLKMLSAGQAWFYRRFKNELPPARRQAYDSAHSKARAQGRGLWAEADPTPPWEFRRQYRRRK